MFGTKSSPKTMLVLDIENGSVGSALVRLSPDIAPHLFGEVRARVPVMDTRSAATLLRAVEHAASESLLHASEVAARLRHANALGPTRKAVIFLSAPWGVPNLAAGRPDFSQALTTALAPRIRSLFGDIPVSFHAHASAAAHGLRTLYPGVPDALLVSANGEVTELLLIENGRVIGHATAPVGAGTVLRTLKSHAGQSLAEAQSALRLMHHSEAADAAAEHFVGEFRDAASELLRGRSVAHVFVLAHEPASHWFARALSRPSLAALFPQGGTVRAIRGGHLAPLVGSLGTPDAHLGLSALYASAAHRD